VLSARPTAALSGRFPGVFAVDLLTGRTRERSKIALRRPILSGPPDLGVLVRNSKTEVKGRFQRGRHLLWFEPHLLKIRTSRANTLYASLRQAWSPSLALRDSCTLPT
jgi:hypothetical protein